MRQGTARIVFALTRSAATRVGLSAIARTREAIKRFNIFQREGAA
jgi:hypothetical protein